MGRGLPCEAAAAAEDPGVTMAKGTLLFLIYVFYFPVFILEGVFGSTAVTETAQRSTLDIPTLASPPCTWGRWQLVSVVLPGVLW